jgi:hypothetical protein
VLTGTTAVFSIAAVAAAISTETHSSVITAIIAALPQAVQQAPEAAPRAKQPRAATGVTVHSADAGLSARAAPEPAPMFSRPEELPASGVLAERDLTEPHHPDTPLLVFTARQQPPLPVAEVVHMAFAKEPKAPPVPASARAPNARPKAVAWSPDATTPSPMLSYARAPDTIDEPFRVVLGELRTSTADEPQDDFYRPRPRPGDDVLTAWLGGRTPGQFVPGAHPWLQNPLPASVYAQKQQKCLAEGIYFEARGEPESGQAAVAQVILNRVRNPAYPDTICGVVYQNEKRRHKCQFSFACDGRAEIVRSQRAWKTAERIASEVTDGKIWLAEVGDSTHYHANYVRPRWGRRMIKVDKIGAHIFYRTRFGGWS